MRRDNSKLSSDAEQTFEKPYDAEVYDIMHLSEGLEVYRETTAGPRFTWSNLSWAKTREASGYRHKRNFHWRERMNIILLGAPGAGKRTQAEKLARLLHLQQIASGDLFRKAFEERTELGLKAQTYVDLGELVPDEITIPIVLRRLEEPESSQGVVLDGFPRTLTQAQALDADLQDLGRQIDLVIYLRTSRESLLNRITGREFCQANQHVYHVKFNPPKVAGVCDVDGSRLYQRADDKGEPMRRRLVRFSYEITQVLDYYRKQGKLREVNGDQSIDRIQAALLDVINDYTTMQKP
jgi:adenylate kinase